MKPQIARLVGADGLAQLRRAQPRHRADVPARTLAHALTYRPRHCAGALPDSPVTCMHNHARPSKVTVVEELPEDMPAWGNFPVDLQLVRAERGAR